MGQRSGLRLRALAGGAIVTTLLVVGFTALAVVAIDGTRSDVDRIARSAERSTFLIGHLGRQLSRMRANALEAVTEPGMAERAEALSRTRTIGARLEGVLDELPAGIPRSELPLWWDLVPRLTAYRRAIDDAVVALERGEDGRAEQILDELEAVARGVQDDIEMLATVDRHTTQRMLDAAEARMRRVALSVALLGGVLSMVVAGIWMVLYRMVGSARAELALHIERVESVNRELDAFAGRIAHDMRNVVSPLPMVAALLRERDHPAAARHELADRLERVSTHASRLIDGLLRFARSDHAAPSDAAASLRSSIADVMEEHEGLQRQVEARMEVDADDLWVAMPPALLHVVLSNLVSNALKHLAGREERTVRICARSRDGRCDLRVEDTGAGIPPDDLRRVFQAFYRVPGTPTAGVGLGLATVRRVVEAHGGHVELDSQLGCGTSVRVVLPARASPQPRRVADGQRRRSHVPGGGPLRHPTPP